MSKSYTIKRCRSCLSEKMIDILSLGEQYLSDFTLDNKKPKKYPLDLVLCNNCYLLQLRHTAPKEKLYTERYGYKSGINKTMQNELKEIVEKSQGMLKDNKIKNLVVVDIGANDGTLLSNYQKNIFKIGIEPIKKFAKQCREYANIVINDFFNADSYKRRLGNKKAHLITSISCFYDIDNPNNFLRDIKKILQQNGVFIIQQNYLVGMLMNNAFDNIVHEHLEYYSLLSLEKLLSRHGLDIFHVEKSVINGGSFITFISHKKIKSIQESVFRWREYEKALKLNEVKIYNDFTKRVKKNKRELYNLIVDLVRKNKTIYVYGASTRGNTLLQYCNLNNKLIKAAVERNSEKWGKKIASVGIPIISEEQARLEKPDYMLVLPWFFKEEFLKREKKYLENGGHFIFPLPELQIV